MPKIKRGVVKRKRKKRLLARASGFWGTRKSNVRIARIAVMKAMDYATRHRKAKKRDMRGLWIVRIGAACRAAGVTYSRFMHGLSQSGVRLDRKTLAYLAAEEPKAFAQLVEISKSPPAD